MREGILVDEVQGTSIADKKDKILAYPRREQGDLFYNVVMSPVEQGLLLAIDSILLHNLILGRTSDMKNEEIIITDPKIITFSDPSTVKLE